MPFSYDRLVRRDYSGCDVLWFSANQSYDPGSFVENAPPLLRGVRGQVASAGAWLSSGTWLSSARTGGSDVIACTWTKTIDGRAAGICVLTLKKGRAWDTLVRPGDALVLFMSSTAGTETRTSTFISIVFVDRVEEGRAVDGTGATVETVLISARDVGKIFEETSTVFDPAFAQLDQPFYTIEFVRALGDRKGLSPMEMVLNAIDILYNHGRSRSKYVEMQWRFPGAEQLPIVSLIDFANFVQAPMFGYCLPHQLDLAAAGNVWTLLTGYANDVVNEMFVDVRDVDDASLESMDYQSLLAANFVDSDDARSQIDLKYAVNVRFSGLASGNQPTRGILTTIGSAAEDPAFLAALTGEDPVRAAILGRRIPQTAGRVVPSKKASTLAFVMRQYPYDTGSFFKLPGSVIDETEVIQSNLGHALHNVFNFFRLSSNPTIPKIAQEIQLGIFVNPKSIARFGLRRKDFETQYILRNHAAAINWDRGKEVSAYLFQAAYDYYVELVSTWNAFNERFLEGTIVCHFRPDVRVGTKLELVRRTTAGETYSIYAYVQAVRHSFVFEPGRSQTSLTLVRGIDTRNAPAPEANIWWTSERRWLPVEDPYEKFIGKDEFVVPRNEPGDVDPTGG